MQLRTGAFVRKNAVCSRRFCASSFAKKAFRLQAKLERQTAKQKPKLQVTFYREAICSEQVSSYLLPVAPLVGELRAGLRSCRSPRRPGGFWKGAGSVPVSSGELPPRPVHLWPSVDSAADCRYCMVWENQICEEFFSAG